MILSNGISILHFTQTPKFILFICFSTVIRLISFFSDSLSAASTTLLLLIASILETLPIAFSGAIGLLYSLYSSIFFAVSCISFWTLASIIFFFSFIFTNLIFYIIFLLFLYYENYYWGMWIYW